MGNKPGRKRKPVETLRLEGGFRPQRHGERGETEPQIEGDPAKPADLDEAAQAHWDDVVPRLVKAKIATAADSEALAEMCRWWSRLQAFHAKGQSDRRSVMNGVSLLKAWRDFACKFGMTPADRAALVVKAEPRKAKAASEFVA